MKSFTRIFFLTAVSFVLFSGDFDESTQFGFRIIQDSEARVGRPLTPVSVAGVRRRTRRRTAVATAAVVSTPAVVAVPAPVIVTTPPPATVIIQQ